MTTPQDPRYDVVVSADEHGEWDALAVGWAMSALDWQDEERFAQHLPGCARCTATVRETLYTVADLAYALPDEAPPPSLKVRLMAAVAVEPQDIAPPATPALPVAPAVPELPTSPGPIPVPDVAWSQPGADLHDWFVRPDQSSNGAHAPEAGPTATEPGVQPHESWAPESWTPKSDMPKSDMPASQPRASQPPESWAAESQPRESWAAESQPRESQPYESQPYEPWAAESQPYESQPRASQPYESRAAESRTPESQAPESQSPESRPAGVRPPDVGAAETRGPATHGPETPLSLPTEPSWTGTSPESGPARNLRHFDGVPPRRDNVVPLEPRRRRQRILSAVAAAAAVVIIAALGVWNVQLRSDRDGLQQISAQRDGLQQIVAQRDAAIRQLTANGPARVAALTDTGKPSATRQATLVVSGNRVEIIVESLGATRGDQTYWLWTLKCDTAQVSDLKPIRGFTVTQSEFSVRDIGSKAGVSTATCFALSSEVGTGTPTTPRKVVAVGQPK